MKDKHFALKYAYDQSDESGDSVKGLDLKDGT